MKKFDEILLKTQEELKSYLCNYLCGVGYKIESADGYIFAKGDVPVLLIAHLDTARKEIPTDISIVTIAGVQKISAKDTLVGGDDRCGVWMIMNIIKEVKCNVLFLEDEELGCIGARKFARTKNIDYIKENISFMIELDRRGSNDCVYYGNDNREFVKYIVEKTGTKENYGTMSDISVLMPSSGVAGVNLSCGYYCEHTKFEYIVVNEMNDIMRRVKDFLTTETEFPKYKYVPKQYTFNGYSGYNKYSGYYDDYDDDDDYRYYTKKANPITLAQKALRSINEICLTVVLKEDLFEEGADNELEACGKNKAECWANLFLENEDVCFSMIERYYFS